MSWTRGAAHTRGMRRTVARMVCLPRSDSTGSPRPVPPSYRRDDRVVHSLTHGGQASVATRYYRIEQVPTCRSSPLRTQSVDCLLPSLPSLMSVYYIQRSSRLTDSCTAPLHSSTRTRNEPSATRSGSLRVEFSRNGGTHHLLHTWSRSDGRAMGRTDHFHLRTGGVAGGTDEISFYCGTDSVKIKTHAEDIIGGQNTGQSTPIASSYPPSLTRSSDDALNARPYNTELVIDVAEFDTYNVTDEPLITFALREFKVSLSLPLLNTCSPRSLVGHHRRCRRPLRTPLSSLFTRRTSLPHRTKGRLLQRDFRNRHERL